MDRLEAMSLLVTVSDTGSFSAASRRLGVPLPTISRKIAELEAHLKTRLLLRTTRKLTLTEAGAAYLSACKRILDQISDAEITASGEYTAPRGELVLAAPVVLGRLHVIPTVNDFLKRYPEINVRMSLSDKDVNLLDDHVDLAVRVGELPDSNLTATKVGTVRRVVCGSPEYFKSHGTPTSPSDLERLTCVTFAGLGEGQSWRFASSGRMQDRRFRPSCRLNINTAEAAIDAAISGIGVTHVLSYQVAKPVQEGRLKIVLKNFEPEPMPVSLIHSGQAPLPYKVRSFIDFATPHLRRALTSEKRTLVR